ncbi:unnamed protein product, partial [Nesidiocoris tenuis]
MFLYFFSNKRKCYLIFLLQSDTEKIKLKKQLKIFRVEFQPEFPPVDNRTFQKTHSETQLSNDIMERVLDTENHTGDSHVTRESPSHPREDAEERNQKRSSSHAVQFIRKHDYSSSECSTRSRDERLRIPGRDGHQENGPAQDEDGVREKLERPQTRAERPGVHREDAGSSRTVADHRRSSTSAVGSPSPGCRRHRPRSQNQRNKLKLDNMSLPSPERHRPLRHLYSSDNMHVPPFNIPNLRIEQRKTSSAEDMARKNSTGGDRMVAKCFLTIDATVISIFANS